MTIRRLSVEDLYWEEVEQARRISPQRKLALGLELYDRARALLTAGIRSQHPEADEQTVRHLVRERLRLARQLENEP
jgi:hypothetical protein